ncbi:MAG: UbiA-like polyprenyltransferase [Planctomycetota bacterium]
MPAGPRIADYLSLVKFSHSIFALPFALISLLLATHGYPAPGLLALVVLCAVSARTAAMAFNRLVDVEIDRQNPRTRRRELPSGKVSRRAALVMTLVSAALFVLLAGAINPLCLALSPVVLLLLLGYSYTKRFTWSCHLLLGLALGLAPLGAWIAALGSFEGLLGTPLLLALAVLTWVAGFDVIYACQDSDFDRGLGLHSIPVRFGVTWGLGISAALHLLTLCFLVLVGLVSGLGVWWWLGVSLAALLLVYEHRIVAPGDLSRVGVAFFTVNGLFSLLLAVLTAVEFWAR